VLDRYPEKVKLLFKNYPLRNHRMARPAAMAAMAAHQQGRFWEFHDKIFENFRDLNDDLLVRIGRDLDLDMEKFERDSKNAAVINIINRDVQEASRIGVRGTPTVFINGKQLYQRSPEAFASAIEDELKTDRQP
jgi:protein-disulfide isomerase